MSAAINAKRLLKLADYLETVPRKQFNMGRWGFKSECGFSGCAIGWAVHGRLFRGLSGIGINRSCPKFEGRTAYGAIATLFGISEQAAEHKLFGGYIEGTPKQVAARIRKFVRDHSGTITKATGAQS